MLVFQQWFTFLKCAVPLSYKCAISAGPILGKIIKKFCENLPWDGINKITYNFPGIVICVGVPYHKGDQDISGLFVAVKAA
jgi:hypothetical protein